KGETLIDRSVESATLDGAVAAMSQALGEHGFRRFSAVGHRVLHGGPDYMSPQKVTPQLILALSRCVPFAPLHLPGQLEVIRTITTHYPDLPQVACFDTAFHRRIPELAQRFSMPRFLWDEGIRRYGFHGLSFEFIVASPHGSGKPDDYCPPRQRSKYGCRLKWRSSGHHDGANTHRRHDDGNAQRRSRPGCSVVPDEAEAL